MTSVAPWGRVTESPDEMIFSGSFAPIFVLGALCVAIALSGCIVYGFYQSVLVQTFSNSLRISPLLLQIIAISLLAFFLVLGLLVMFLNSKTTLVRSKHRGQIFLQTETWLGSTKIRKTYNISDVLRVELRRETRMEKVLYGRGRPGRVSPIAVFIAHKLTEPEPVLYQSSIIVFKDGGELLLGRMRTLSPMGSLGPIAVETIGVPLVAHHVATFLGVPSEETNGEGVSDARIPNSNI